MIASLRNGLADGLTVTRHHHSVSAARYRPRHIHLSSRAPDGLSWRFSGAVAVYRPCVGVRYIASRTTGESPAKDIPLTVPATSPKKHKVELRPGPVKPQKASSEATSIPPPSATLSAAPESSTATPHAPSDASKSHVSTHPESVIETAKEDYFDASQHGILAPPPEGASWVRKLYHQGKELFKFYWNGVKLINIHRKRVRAIEARVKSGGTPLSRRESRFIALYKEDALKLIPFILIVIIAEEVIPLVVIYAPFLLPSTCLLPSQKERIENKRREKQKTYAESMRSIFQGVHSRAVSEPELSADALLKDRSVPISYLGLFAQSTFGPPPIRIRRVKKHLSSIADDDAFLLRENHGEHLTALALREALEERGIITEGLTTDAMRARLHWWLTESAKPESDPIRKRLELVAANVVGKHN
ncbi:hypothetical protein L226DRAFT_531719 [Lentinus tigrinus ALCF2SS1-7]|uniref:uncharacterized protein n=1 Tax=Lentinus tigrinus ALCF2SS1-7 TaxID=1328758 RepID=UPI0011663729|nr:hypothetical protein L226DRAFT_531719 [Lentinus tigrinus ALCF2SS1-7]